MAGEFSNIAEADTISWWLTATATGSFLMARPTAWFLALHSAAGATETNSGWTATEVASAGTAYARQAISFATPTTSGASVSTSNSASLAFPVATGAGYSPTHAAVWDSGTYTSGNLIFYIDTNNLTVAATEQVTVAAGGITFEVQ